MEIIKLIHGIMIIAIFNDDDDLDLDLVVVVDCYIYMKTHTHTHTGCCHGQQVVKVNGS